MADKKARINLEVPTLEQLKELPREALWIELNELAEHGPPEVQRKANEILNDDNADPTPELIHSLWVEYDQAPKGTW